MDFVSNMWSKTGLKKGGDQEDKQELDPSTDNTNATTDQQQQDQQQSEQQQKNGSSTVGLVSGFIKSTFNKGSDGSERKTSVAESESGNKQDESSGGVGAGAKGFVTNMFKNPFKRGDGDTSRKTSDAGSLTGTTTDPSEIKDGGEGEQLVEGEGNESHVGQKAIDSAKSFGGFLVNVANKAGQTVSATATKVKHTVVSNSLLADFTKEQQEFIKEHGTGIEASDPPWVGCENEEEVKKEIISLSQDKRNFVRNPPAGLTFDFDLQSSLPVALSILKEDPQLAKMRFEVVPKLVNEETFWRNYFYRISLVKQSTAANSLKCKSKKGWGGSTSSSEAEGPDDEISPSNDGTEFVSDTFQGDGSADAEVRKGMKALGVKRGDSKTSTASSSADDKKWEEELKKDLQEFEVVGGSEIPEEELDKDLADLM